jgi:flavin-dependent dehydrogenase
MRFDVVVIGSGPAASATAIRCLRIGIKTAICIAPARRNRFEIPQTLSAILRPQLEDLNFWERFQRIGLRHQYSMSSAWGSDQITTRHSICHPWGPGWFINRTVFDAELLQHAVGEGAMPISARILSVSRVKDRWILNAGNAENSDPELIETRLVVDATGRSSVFARQIGVRRFAFDRQVCINALALPRDVPAGEAFVESEPEGWWFIVPTERDELAVARFTEASMLQPADRSIAGFECRLRAVPHTSLRVDRILPGTIQATVACTDRLEVCAGDGWFAVGDAALACDPLASQGVLRALESAEIVARIISNCATKNKDSIAEYSEFQERALERFLRDRQYFYSIERRWPQAAFWRQRSGYSKNPKHAAV